MEKRMSGWERDFSESWDSWNRLDAQRQMWTERSKNLTDEVGKAKGRLEMQPKVADFLERLQERVNARAVGVYADLLSAIVADVLPGDRRIELDLSMERGLPSLDVHVNKGGKIESVMEGSGGAVTNVVSAGLRMIALARSGHRQFIAMDEPDCWLKPSRVPQFASVIGQIAKEIGVQVLLVSHHEPSFFEGMSTIVRLVHRDGGIACEIEGGERRVWNSSEDKGLRWIRLENFMSHKDTMIPLFPGVTCLTGDNDLGKSAVLAAFRSLFDGDSSDAFVRHDEKSFRVSVGFEGGFSVSMEHFLKKSPKRKWELRCASEPEALQDGSPKSGVPDWLSEFSPMGRVEGLDIHFANQKTPVFLLNEPSGSKRASILSVGRESGHLVKMQAKAKERVLSAQTTVREGERELSKMTRGLELLSNSEERLAHLSKLREEGSRLEKAEESLLASLERLTKTRKLSDKVSVLSEGLAKFNHGEPPRPDLKAGEALAVLKRVERLTRYLENATPQSPPGFPEKPAFDASEMLFRLKKTRKICATLNETKRMAPIKMADRPESTAALRSRLSRAKKLSSIEGLSISKVHAHEQPPSTRAWREGLAKIDGLSEKRKLAKKNLEAVRAEISALRAKTEAFLSENTRCPTCRKAATIEDIIGTEKLEGVENAQA